MIHAGFKRVSARSRLEQAFGQPPQNHYQAGDLEAIRSYYDYHQTESLDDFTLDEITWRDLGLDDLFKRLNNTLSTSGEQYLYYLLRAPAQDAAEYARRKALLGYLEQAPELRLKLQLVLDRLGKRRQADIRRLFQAQPRGGAVFPLATLLMLGLLASLAAWLTLWSGAMLPFLLLLMFNPLFHQWLTRRLEYELPTVNYGVAMVAACHKLAKLREPSWQEALAPFFAAGRQARGVTRLGAASFTANNELIAMLNALLLLDLQLFAMLKRRLAKQKAQVFLIHEYLGRLDAACAVASYRRGLAVYCEPELDFSAAAPAFYQADGLVHPLLDAPVPNSIATVKPLLLTGSNASGKSTFLKAALLNAVLAQSVCTALADRYAASCFRIYSSMSVSDDLLAGESYFVAEIKAVRRIVAAARGERVLCAIDEVLRGTNTLERIAASSALLEALAEAGALVFAATHDGELCGLLAGSYTLYHFEEQFQGDELVFDYRLRPGPVASRNAIRLLQTLGFEQTLVDQANARVARYLASGKWQ